MMSIRRSCRGFSLIELVIVVVIIGIIAAIAIPRMSRGAAGAADAALSGNLTVLRNAIDLYHTEHGGTEKDYPTVANFVAQLTTFSDLAGATATSKDATKIYGTYLAAVPPLPVGTKRGQTGVAAAIGAAVGWVYDDSTGAIKAGLADDERDAGGKAYNLY